MAGAVIKALNMPTNTHVESGSAGCAHAAQEEAVKHIWSAITDIL